MAQEERMTLALQFALTLLAGFTVLIGVKIGQAIDRRLKKVGM